MPFRDGLQIYFAARKDGGTFGEDSLVCEPAVAGACLENPQRVAHIEQPARLGGEAVGHSIWLSEIGKPILSRFNAVKLVTP